MLTEYEVLELVEGIMHTSNVSVNDLPHEALVLLAEYRRREVVRLKSMLAVSEHDRNEALRARHAYDHPPLGRG